MTRSSVTHRKHANFPRICSTLGILHEQRRTASTYFHDGLDNFNRAPKGSDAQTLARKAAARGQALFNTKTFNISGVAGLNDASSPSTVGSCTICHNTPDVGGHSSAFFVDIGIADGARRTSDMPLYTLRNKTTRETKQTTDPGLALSTGKWADIGRFKVPNLRAVETQSPYFHSGFRDSIEGLVDFYDGRFGIALTAGEKADLAAFVKVL